MALAIWATGHGLGLYRMACLNVAHLAVARWSLAPWDARPERHLATALQWGRRAGEMWMRDGRGERAQVLLDYVAGDQWIAARSAQDAFDRGQALEANGQLEPALKAYQQALSSDGRRIEAGYSVYRLATQMGHSSLAQEQLDKMAALSPEYPVTTTLDGGATLLGYDLDEIALDRDVGPISITLYWELSNPAGEIQHWHADGWSYVVLQHHLYQIGAVENLLPNGGFEAPLSTVSALPAGYVPIGSSLGRRPGEWPGRYQLVAETRLDRTTRVVSIAGLGTRNGMTVGVRAGVEPNARYVLAGWMSVEEGGIAYLGGLWLGADKKELRYSYPARARGACDWEYVASYIIAPKNAASFILLADNKGTSPVRFDDLVLFQLPAWLEPPNPP